ncbi:MAG: hypothetical protein IBJ18_10775 [Phycisphaerales bacterium]|nr:hypothetical protein [Phycisphaerales bacterium]
MNVSGGTMSLRSLTTRAIAIASLSSLLLLSGGCYKSAMEAEKARADTAESKAAALEEKLASVNKQVETMRVPAMKYDNISRGAKLGVYVDGQRIGEEQLRFDETKGEFVRNGTRSRSTSVIRYENGRLSDQMMKVTRENGTLMVEGAIRNSRPDGDWIFYSAEGKPSIKETWKDGKLEGLFSASITKPKTTTTKPKTTKPATGATTTTPPPTTPAPAEQVTWKALSKAEKDERLKKTAAMFASIQELVRQ